MAFEVCYRVYARLRQPRDDIFACSIRSDFQGRRHEAPQAAQGSYSCRYRFGPSIKALPLTRHGLSRGTSFPRKVWFKSIFYAMAHSIPRSRCSSRSCHTVLPEHEHTVLSSAIGPWLAATWKEKQGRGAGRFERVKKRQVRFIWQSHEEKRLNLLSQTPALRAITPTNVSASFLSNCSKSAPRQPTRTHWQLTFPSCSLATTILLPIISQI